MWNHGRIGKNIINCTKSLIDVINHINNYINYFYTYIFNFTKVLKIHFSLKSGENQDEIDEICNEFGLHLEGIFILQIDLSTPKENAEYVDV